MIYECDPKENVMAIVTKTAIATHTTSLSADSICNVHKQQNSFFPSLIDVTHSNNGIIEFNQSFNLTTLTQLGFN